MADKEDDKFLREQGEIAMRRKLTELTDSDYARYIGDAILEDVLEDVRETSDFNHGTWSYDDIELAIGRVLCKRLGIEDGSVDEPKAADPEPPAEVLKPCPKCGSTLVWTVHPALDGGAYIACPCCFYSPQAETWAPTDNRAIYKWNRLKREDENV